MGFFSKLFSKKSAKPPAHVPSRANTIRSTMTQKKLPKKQKMFAEYSDEGYKKRAAATSNKPPAKAPAPTKKPAAPKPYKVTTAADRLKNRPTSLPEISGKLGSKGGSAQRSLQSFPKMRGTSSMTSIHSTTSKRGTTASKHGSIMSRASARLRAWFHFGKKKQGSNASRASSRATLTHVRSKRLNSTLVDMGDYDDEPPAETKWGRRKQLMKKNFRKFCSIVYYICLTISGDSRVEALQTDPTTGKLVLTGINRESKDKDTEVVGQAYSQDLHNILSLMWVPVDWSGRLPFRVKVVHGVAVIAFKKWSKTYFRCLLATLILWVLLLWFCGGLCYVFFGRDLEHDPDSEMLTNYTASKDGEKMHFTDLQKRNGAKTAERQIFGNYWIDLLIFFLALFMLAIASTNQLVTGKIYARFVRNWYIALDQSKVSIHSSLRRYIVIHWTLLVLLALLMFVLFFMGDSYPAMVRTSELIIAAYVGPFIPHDALVDGDGKLYFQHVAVFGLCIYIFVIAMAWFNTLIYLVFGRCFTKGLRVMNNRIRMLCQPLEAPKVGPNALRVNMMDVHKDYVAIVFAGMAQSRTFGYVLFWDTALTLVLVIVQTGILAYYGLENPTGPYGMWKFHNPYPGTKIKQTDPGIAHVVNSFGHFVLSLVRILVVVWAPAENFREGRIGYDYVTFKGLVLAKTQLERNFVRSIWILSLPKYPFVINAKGFIKMTRGMMIAFMANAFTYFVFMVQSREQLVYVDHPERFNPAKQIMYPNGTIVDKPGVMGSAMSADFSTTKFTTTTTTEEMIKG